MDNYERVDKWLRTLYDGAMSTAPKREKEALCIGLDRETFFNADNYTACTTYIHEPLHDFWKYGIGHDGINDIVGPYEDDNDFNSFWKFRQICVPKK